MGFFNSYTPYVEAPTIRTTTQPVSGGIVIDKGTAQGTSFRNPILRQTTLLPQINSGRTDFVIECLNFGVHSAIDEMSPYDDREKLTTLKYLADPDQFGYPLLVGSFLPNDGAIEPLTIRDVATRDSIEDPISHRIRGTIMCGNEDNFDGSDVKSSFIQYEKNNDFVPFEDPTQTIANGSISILGFVANALNDKIIPFDESGISTKFQTTNPSINAQLLLMTGSIDDDFRPSNSKSSTSGFIYSNKEGTDSIAFGGLLNL